MSSPPVRIAARLAAVRLVGCEHHGATCSRCLADAILPLLAEAWERGHRGCPCGPPARCGNPYQPPPHPCGHRSIERGCGGCDPSAIEYEFGGDPA